MKNKGDTMRGILFVLSGPSGTGKGTVCERILEREDTLAISVSATTRERKNGEVDGKTYHYVTICFENQEDNDEFIIRDVDLFIKVSQAKKEYEDNQIVEQQKKNFKLLKLLKGE